MTLAQIQQAEQTEGYDMRMFYDVNPYVPIILTQGTETTPWYAFTSGTYLHLAYWGYNEICLEGYKGQGNAFTGNFDGSLGIKIRLIGRNTGSVLSPNLTWEYYEEPTNSPIYIGNYFGLSKQSTISGFTNSYDTATRSTNTIYELAKALRGNCAVIEIPENLALNGSFELIGQYTDPETTVIYKGRTKINNTIGALIEGDIVEIRCLITDYNSTNQYFYAEYEIAKIQCPKVSS